MKTTRISLATLAFAALVMLAGIWARRAGLSGPYHFDFRTTSLKDPASARSDLGVEQLGLPGNNEAMERARFLIAEEKAGHVFRMVIIYPLVDFSRTVIQHARNLTDYPRLAICSNWWKQPLFATRS